MQLNREESMKKVFSPPNSLFELLSPEASQLTRSILSDSLQVGGNLPLLPAGDRPCRNLIVIDDVLNCKFLDIQTSAVTIPSKLGYQLQIVDRNTLANVGLDTRDTLLQIFIRGNPFRGNAGFTPQTQKIYEGLIANNRLKGLIIYGSPYILDWFVTKIFPELPWIFTYGQMPEAQKIALETIFNLATDGLQGSFSQDFGF